MVTGDNEGNLRYADFDYTTILRHYIWVLSVEKETTLTFYYEDLTARVGVTAEDWHAGGSVPDWAAPEVITHDGRRTPLAEVYEETTETTGTVMEQTITGLPIGSYQVTLYANAYYTPDRGFDSDVTEGQADVVYCFANDMKTYIPAHIGTSVTEHDGVILDCDVTDGTLHLGMVAEKPGTNWHSIQIRSLDRKGDVSVGIKGDANGDGTVDVADIATVISYMAGQTAGLVKEKSDVNGDGTVDVADIAAIIEIMANGGIAGETYYWYAGQNPDENYITSGTTLKPVASDMSTTDTSVKAVSTKTLNGVTYQIYTYGTGSSRKTIMFAK